MAESEPQMSGASVAPASQEDDHLPIQQSTDAKDAVELRDLGDRGRSETEEAPTLPPKDDEPAAGSAGRTDEAGDGTKSTKGKEKEENPPAPIEKIDPLAQESPDAATAAPAITSTTSSPADGSVCNITLLLPTGARHPYRIDEKYLSKRSVDVPDLDESGKKDPFSISIYKLKELILREWRDEWDGKPASPSSIRLIHFGKLLDDKEQLKKYQFSADSPNVVHMSVRPAEMVEEDEQSKAKSSGRDGRPREGGSGCCVIL